MRDNLVIGAVGSGGDGVMLLGGLLMQTLAKLGYTAMRPQTYEAQIRGGGSAVKVNISTGPSIREKDELDILICFSWKEFLKVKDEFVVTENTVVICEEEPPAGQKGRFVLFPFSRLAKETVGDIRPKNMVVFSLLVDVLGLDRAAARAVIEEIFSGKKYLTNNLKGFNVRVPAAVQRFQEMADILLAAPSSAGPKIVLHGNEAVVRGAIRAGCRTFFGYPITPASEQMESAIPKLLESGGVGLQVEDEIAAISMAIGASQAGSKTLVATSGPGLSLMTESRGLAVQDEVPLVLSDVQRAGPATGIPTKTEQADLNLAVYGAHGDAPAVVLAPFDIEGCFRLAAEAFNISEELQVPVILLTDQLLGQTLFTCDDFSKKEYLVKNRLLPSESERKDYRRYKITPSLVSPMALPGMEGYTYQTSGLTHNEKGEPASDHETHQLMHRKRWEKLLPLQRRRELVKLFGNQKAKTGIIVWGSSAQAVVSAVFNLGLEEKIKVAAPELLFPVPELALADFLKGVKKLFFIEMNYSAQFYRIVKAWLDYPLPRKRFVYSRPGGKPFSQKELCGRILEVTDGK